MPEVQSCHSPLLRSLSSKDLRNKTESKAPLKKALYGETQGVNADGIALTDFENMFSRRVHVGDDMEGQNDTVSRSSFSSKEFKEQISQAVDSTTIKAEEEDDDEDDDEEFANVDEIDGPISPSSSSGSLKDYFQSLEISLSQHSPKQIRRKSIEIKDYNDKQEPDDEKVTEDENLPIDDALKKLLDEKACQIESGDHLHPITKPRLDWSYKAFYSLVEELDEWFIQKDYGSLKKCKLCFEKKYDPKKFNEDYQYAQGVIVELGRKIEINSMDISALLSIAYVCFGNFGDTSSFLFHLDIIRRNNLLLIPISRMIISCMKRHAECCRDKKSNLNQFTTLFFYSSTILFFIVCVSIDQREKRKVQVGKLIDEVCGQNLLLFMTKYIDHWRWNSRLSMRIRNIIILFQKVLLLQFGTDENYEHVNSYVHKKHNVNEKDATSANLKIMPLDFVAFREDITSRYPSCTLPVNSEAEELDNPNSLSQFLEIARPKSRSTSNENLPEPQIHIATPAPSPPSSPAPVVGNKVRKSFQTNIAYPSLFPSSMDSEQGILDELDNMKTRSSTQTEIPCNIREAIDIITKSIEVDLSTKQLWYERKQFMKQERGWVDIRSDDEDPFSYCNAHEDEAKIMVRIEEYYHQALPHMASLVYVLLETIETSIPNKVYLEEEDSDACSSSIKPHLELLRSKEIAMRSSSSILVLLLRWFKLSHVLKFEYLSSLIYDSKYIRVSTAVLNGFAVHHKERIFGKTLDVSHSFWKECASYNQSYRSTLEDSVLSKSSNEFNIRMLSAEVSLLSILENIVGKKTQRLKELPLTVGNIFNILYQVYNLDIYHPILRIVHQLTPFKNKKWRSEHMELISGVFLYEKLSLTDNWVTGKDVTGELNDAYGQEIALRAMLQFYNFYHYKDSMEQFGYDTKASNSFFSREAELLSVQY